MKSEMRKKDFHLVIWFKGNLGTEGGGVTIGSQKSRDYGGTFPFGLSKYKLEKDFVGREGSNFLKRVKQTRGEYLE